LKCYELWNRIPASSKLEAVLGFLFILWWSWTERNGEM
jgi:hypothetical protein